MIYIYIFGKIVTHYRNWPLVLIFNLGLSPSSLNIYGINFVLGNYYVKVISFLLKFRY